MLGVSPCHTHSMVSMPPPGHTSMQHGDNEFDMLQQSYTEYSGALGEPCAEAGKARLASLSDQLQAKGVYGSNAVHLLHKYSNQINWQGMNHEVFTSFYRFVYFICREPGKRNVQVGTAVAAWRLVLCGRFRLLDRWCTYVSHHHKASVVMEDTWRQVLDFSRTVHEDLSNYDPASAWPVLLDEFVEYIKGGGQHRPQPLFVEPLDLYNPGSMRAIAAVSPRSGSKRRPPDVLEVADQLQQLPLAESGMQAQSAANGVQRSVLTAKRVRLNGQQVHQYLSGGGNSSHGPRADTPALAMDQQGLAAVGASGAWPPTSGYAAHQQRDAVFPVVPGSADASNTRTSSNRRVVGSAGGAGGGMCAFGQPGVDHSNQQQQPGQQQHQQLSGARGPPSHVQGMQQQQQHRMLAPGGPSIVAAPAGLAMRESGLTGGGAAGLGQQQQQPQEMSCCHLAGRSSGSSFIDVLMGSPPQQQQQPGRAQQQQQHAGVMYMPGQHAHCAAQLPPCPSPGHVHPQQQHFRSEADLRRTNSVIAMMQVTVTEALGFN